MDAPQAAQPHAAIVYNPVKVQIHDLRRAAAAEQRRRGWAMSQWFATSSDDDGRAAARDAVAGGAEVVIVAGGDGTVRVVADVVLDSGRRFALLPSGTGNLLARNLGMALGDLERGMAIAFGESTRDIDVAVATLERADATRSREVFLVMAGIGLDADMAQNTNEVAKRHLGWVAYAAPIARSVIANRNFHVRYRIDGGTTRSTRAHTIIVGNCGTLTGDMLLLPDAQIDDGLLDVVMMRPRGRFEWARIATRLAVQGVAHRTKFGQRMMQRAPKLRALAFAQGRQFDIRFGRPHGVELDGDSFGEILGARITIRPAALQVCVEADSDS